MVEQPLGTVTLLFTDIEGSTALLRQLGKELYAEVLEQHHRLLRAEFDRCGGYEVDCEGDSFFVAFAAVEAAVDAAASAQLALTTATWPAGGAVRVRMGIHTGEPLVAAPKYVGVDVHRAARIMAAAHGRQVLVSRATAQILGEGDPSSAVCLRDLGSHRLKDLPDPQPLYQLLVDGLPEEFPPLRTIGVGNLPQPLNSLVGRDNEVEELVSLLRGGNRLVTITGEGGCGKTRLALEVAHIVAADYEDGAFFVPLARITDAARVANAVAEPMGLRGTTGREAGEMLTDVLRDTRTLLVLDNFEHVLEAAPLVSAVVAAAPRVTVLTTSRERLHLDAERVRLLDPLPLDDAATLFVSRIERAVPDERTVGAIVERLDGLPLALELAAARVDLLGLEVLLQRLEDRFAVLRTVRHDAPERQQTLLATIEWSYELLTDDERGVLVALALFPSGCTLDMAEQVCGAEVDTLASLFDKSLVRSRNEPDGVRFWMLETIREFALRSSDFDLADLRARRLRFYRDLAERLEREIWGPEQSSRLARLDREHENMLLALSDGFESPETVVDAARLAAALVDYWDIRAEFAEAEKWYELALSRDATALPQVLRARVLISRSVFAARRGDRLRAYELASEALTAFGRSGADREEARALEIMIAVSDIDDPVQLSRAAAGRDRALELTGRSDDPLAVGHALAAVQQHSQNSGDLHASADLTRRMADHYRAIGDERNYGISVHHEAYNAALAGNYAEAAARTSAALAIAEDLGDHAATSWCLQLLAEAQLGAAAIDAARETLARAIGVAEKYGMREALASSLVTAAAVAAASGAGEDAAVLAGAADANHASPEKTFPHTAWSLVETCRERHESDFEFGRRLPLPAAIDRARQALESIGKAPS